MEKNRSLHDWWLVWVAVEAVALSLTCGFFLDAETGAKYFAPLDCTMGNNKQQLLE
jgi:hypothetical protein